MFLVQYPPLECKLHEDRTFYQFTDVAPVPLLQTPARFSSFQPGLQARCRQSKPRLRARQVTWNPSCPSPTHKEPSASYRPRVSGPRPLPDPLRGRSRDPSSPPPLRTEPSRVLKAVQAALTVRVLLTVALVVALHLHVLQKGLHLLLVLEVHHARHRSRSPSQNHPATLPLATPPAHPPHGYVSRRRGGAWEGHAAEVRGHPGARKAPFPEPRLSSVLMLLVFGGPIFPSGQPTPESGSSLSAAHFVPALWS